MNETQFNTDLNRAMDLVHNLLESFPDNHPDFPELTRELERAFNCLNHVQAVVEFVGFEVE